MNQDNDPKTKKRVYVYWSQEQHELFVKRWQAADSVKEVADAFGLSYQHISNRAVNLRKKGVPLKHMRGNRHRIDYDALTELAEQLGKAPKEQHE